MSFFLSQTRCWFSFCASADCKEMIEFPHASWRRAEKKGGENEGVHQSFCHSVFLFRHSPAKYPYLQHSHLVLGLNGNRVLLHADKKQTSVFCCPLIGLFCPVCKGTGNKKN